jgi:hypothetical protein
MDKTLRILDVEIEKIKSENNDTSIGISMLGIFFLAILPLFYTIMGMYQFTFRDIELPLILAIMIIFIATILAVLKWENNTQKLKKLYAQKVELIKAEKNTEHNHHSKK